MKKILAIILLAVAPLTWAWQPTKPVEVIIAFSPGSVNETSFRATAKEVEQNTKAKFNVVYRAGAGGVIGTEELKDKPADGYSITVVSVPGIAAMDKVQVPEFGKGRSYTVDSFVYPTLIAQSPHAVISSANDPVKTPKDFIEVLKKEKVEVAAFGGSRLVYEELLARLKFKEGSDGVVRLDYKGPADALNDVAGGHLRFAIIPVSVVNSMYQAGKINIIALTGSHKIPQLPNVGTLSEAVPKFDVTGMWMLMLPAGAPSEVVEWYQKEFSTALKSKSVKDVFFDNLWSERLDLQNAKSAKEFMKAKDKEWQPLVDAAVSKLK
jgi:tripartite-type tricarboxylate transporter receptor subunit TctC